MKSRTRSLLTMISLPFVVAGCLSRTVQRPQVDLAGVRLGSIGLTGGTAHVRLEVANPNNFDIEASSLTYDVDLADARADDSGWVDFTEGTLTQRIRVPANGRSIVEVPVEFSYRTLGRAARALIDEGSFEYRLSGVVELRRPVGREVRFDHDGVLRIDDLGDRAHTRQNPR